MISRVLSIAFLLYQLPLLGQWEQRLNTPFTKDHGIGFSLDGFGYVLTGGQNGQVFSSSQDFFKYDPNSDTWEQLNDYPGPPRGYGIGDVWDGKVYFGFGTDGISLLNDLWSWDPSNNSFSQLPSCPCSGRLHPAFVIADAKVYVGAGSDATGDLADFWFFDINTQVWNQIPSIPGERHHPYQFALGNEIYVGNGHLSSWYKYSPGSSSWIQIASLPTRVAGAQFSYNGKGYSLSGTDNDHNSFTTGEFWEYDPVVNSWTALPSHPGSSRFGPTQFVIGNYVYLMGGYDRFDPTSTLIPLNTMWRYNLEPVTLGDEEMMNLEVESNLYPNPSREKLFIKLSEDISLAAEINFYNLTGKIIWSGRFNEVIDVSHLENGTYIIDVVDKNLSVFKQRFTKI